MVMLDVEIPGLDDYQACAALRTEVSTDLPIVMVTGMEVMRSIELAYESVRHRLHRQADQLVVDRPG